MWRAFVVAVVIVSAFAVVFAFLVVIPTLNEAEGERTCFFPFFASNAHIFRREMLFILENQAARRELGCRAITLGCFFLSAWLRSYPACTSSQIRAVLRLAASNRIARSGLIAALPLTTRDNATRDTPKRRAASVMLILRPSSPKLSFNNSPGCGGLCIMSKCLSSDSPHNRAVLRRSR